MCLPGPKCNCRVHHQPERVRLDVLLLQPASSSVNLLAARLASRAYLVSPLPTTTIRSAGRLSIHCPGHHYQQIRHDRPPHTLPQVGAANP